MWEKAWSAFRQFSAIKTFLDLVGLLSFVSTGAAVLAGLSVVVWGYLQGLPAPVLFVLFLVAIVLVGLLLPYMQPKLGSAWVWMRGLGWKPKSSVLAIVVLIAVLAVVGALSNKRISSSESRQSRGEKQLVPATSQTEPKKHQRPPGVKLIDKKAGNLPMETPGANQSASAKVEAGQRVVNNCPNGICISGGTVTTATVNNYGNIEPPPRRLSQQARSELIRVLSGFPKGRISIRAAVNDREAWEFASDFYEIFSNQAVAWEIEASRIQPLGMLKPWTGVKLSIYLPGDQSMVGNAVTVTGTQGALLQIFSKLFKEIGYEYSDSVSPSQVERMPSLDFGPQS